MRIPSSCSSAISQAARRARVSRLPRPQSTKSRVCSVSSSVMLPELPEARMETRKHIEVSTRICRVKNDKGREQIFTMMAERGSSVNEEERKWLAGEPRAIERETVNGTKNSGGDLFGTEKLTCEVLDFFASDRFDGSEKFIQGIKAAKIKFLTREI